MGLANETVCRVVCAMAAVMLVGGVSAVVRAIGRDNRAIEIQSPVDNTIGVGSVGQDMGQRHEQKDPVHYGDEERESFQFAAQEAILAQH